VPKANLDELADRRGAAGNAAFEPEVIDPCNQLRVDEDNHPHIGRLGNHGANCAPGHTGSKCVEYASGISDNLPQIGGAATS